MIVCFDMIDLYFVHVIYLKTYTNTDVYVSNKDFLASSFITFKFFSKTTLRKKSTLTSLHKIGGSSLSDVIGATLHHNNMNYVIFKLLWSNVAPGTLVKIALVTSVKIAPFI